MQVITETSPCRVEIERRRAAGIVGVVPTMGALHAGHRSLIETARRECDTVVATIFVNPTQFGPNEDFDRYPRTWEADLAACEAQGVDVIFAPEVGGMYAADASTHVHVADLTEHLCGAARPGHFDGVTTVVCKLFHIVPAHRAYFGEKDYQQLVAIKRMVRDLDMPVEIVPCPIVREADGLAMSSRNRYLSDRERITARSLNAALLAAQDGARRGESNCETLRASIRRTLDDAGVDSVDYIEIVNGETLRPITTLQPGARICLAVRIGQCRLIDNVAVDPPGVIG